MKRLILLPLLFLGLAGCTSSEVITDLQLAVDAVSVALPLIAPAAGLPATLVAAIDTYLGATSQAISQASTILAGADTDAQKAVAIAAAFAGIAAPLVCPDQAPGAPPCKWAGLAAAIQAVAADVAKFLATEPVAASLAKTASPSHVTTWSASQQAQLAAIKAKALGLAAQAKQ